MEKIKQFLETDKGKDILVVLIVILVGLGSFELGRLSKNEPSSLKADIPTIDPQNDMDITQPPDNSQTSIKTQNTTLVSSSNSGKNFFASSRGSKYYSLTCSAGKTIKQENRVYFDTAKDAEAAGYTLSSSCQ